MKTLKNLMLAMGVASVFAFSATTALADSHVKSDTAKMSCGCKHKGCDMKKCSHSKGKKACGCKKSCAKKK